MSENTQPFNEGNLFIIQNHSTYTDLHTQAATTENIRRHLQQKRRKGEARARGTPTPSWTNFTSVLLLPSRTQGNAPNKLSRLSQPANNSIDPFHSTIIGTDAGSHLSILPIIFGDIVKENFLGEAFAPRDMCTTRKVTRHDGALHQRLVQCVHDELLMYATLAYALSFRSWSAGQIIHTEDSEYFQLKAIQALQSYLRTPQNPINTSVLLSVYSLAITSGWRSMITKKRMLPDPSTPVKAFRGSGQVGHQIHLSALLQLIQDSAGWHNIDPYVLESIILGDKHASFATGVPPMLRPWWDPGPLPVQVSQEFSALTNGVKSTDPELFKQLHEPEIMKIIDDTRQYLHVSVSLWLSGNVSAELESWLSFRLHALQYRFLWAYHEAELLFDRCVSLTALAMLLSCGQVKGLRGGAAWVSQQLCQVVVTTRQLQQDWSDDMVAWVFFTGAMASVSGQEKDLFLSCLRTMGFDKRTSLDHVEKVLTRYLYLKSRQEAQLSLVLSLI